MYELKTVGGLYTCINEHTCNRIDRSVVNFDRMIHIIVLEVDILRSGVSVHALMSLALDNSCKKTYKAFRFLNCIADHPTFLQLVDQAFQGHTKGDMRTVY